MLFHIRAMQASFSCVTRAGPVLRVTVQARPGAKKNSIDEVTQEYVGVHVAAKPQEGAANKELCEFLSEVFGVRKRDVAVAPFSAKSRQKVIEVTTDDISPEQALASLHRLSTRP